MAGKRLIELQNAYLGKRVIYLGTGSSLGDYGLTKLSPDIITFGFNNFIPFYSDFWPNMKLDFYMSHDSKVFQVPFYDQHAMRDKLEGVSNAYSIEKLDKTKSISAAEYILREKIYEKTKIIFCDNIEQERIHRMFNVPTNQEWIVQHKELLEQNNNFITYKINSDVTDYFYPRVSQDDVILPLWAKNSFCSCAMPLLFFLGFSEIYLAGVDYSDNGYFFCEVDENKKQIDNYYIEKEYKQFNFLMEKASELQHKPKIFSIKNDKTKIVAKDGWKEISELMI